MLKKLAVAALGALFLLSAGAARARIGDFAVRPGVSLGDSVTALDFTPDGRFLVILHGKPGTVSFFDTWDMALLSDATADVAVASGATVALSLSVSPYAARPFAYVGLSSGQVAVINYAKATALGALDELTAALPVTYFQMAANPIAQVLAVREFAGDTTSVYLLAGLPAATDLSWVRLISGTTPSGNPIILGILRESVALTRGAKYAYALSRDTSGHHFLNEVECTSTTRVCFLLTSELGIEFPSTDVYSGLAADRAKDVYSVTMNRTQKKEFLMGNFPIPGVSDDFTVADAVALASAPTPFDTNMGDVVLAAGGNTLSVAAQTTAGLTFGGSYAAVNAGIGLTTLVAAGGSEGNAFAGGPGGSVIPFTANPWVTSLTALQTGNTVTLKFIATSKTIGGFRYAFFKNVGFRKWPSFFTGNVLYADTTNTATMPISDLQECANVLTLVVQDSYGRQGRAAISAVKDTNPPAPNFTLGFGRRRMIVDFTVSNLCDLNRYAIFWGDTNSSPVSDFNLLASYGDSVAINSPVAGQAIERTISGLTNGKRYWAQLVAFDKTGHVGVSARLSTVPQTVNTLTSASGEKGGFGCALGRGDDAGGLAWLLLPLLIYAVARVSRREKR